MGTQFVALSAHTLMHPEHGAICSECLERKREIVRPSFSISILSNFFLSLTAIVFGSENVVLFRYFGPCRSNG